MIDWHNVSFEVQSQLENLFDQLELISGYPAKTMVRSCMDEDAWIVIFLQEDDRESCERFIKSIKSFPSIRGDIRKWEPSIFDFFQTTYSPIIEKASLVFSVDSGVSSAADSKSQKIDDVSLPTQDRRTIVVIADGASTKMGGLPHYTISKARQLFKFPPNHPSVNTAYSMVDVYPDHYVLVNAFHEYHKQTKHAAFIELCASLGAKEICIESAEINNQTLDINGEIKAPLASLGLGINVRENRETGMKIAFKFSEANKDVKDFDSPWLYTEPSWMSMNNLRRKNHLAELGAEFTCVDDMGINANLSASLKGVGVNIGGSFQEMTKIRLSYSVIFW